MTLGTFAVLSRLGPVVRTSEAAAALRTSLSHASRSLRQLESRGVARKVRQGLWVVGTEAIDPRALAEEITRPYPAYVSFLSALSTHGVIDQVPRDITVASLDSARRIATPFGTFTVHHLPPPLFGGWEERAGFKLARAEKALFDIAYVSAAHRGRLRSIPELDLPRRFSTAEITRWVNRIDSRRVRTLTARAIEGALQRVRG